ncbi:tetratricopeptide repeat protein [Agarivorans sp. DSG3-1]|uniref:tetratricopeptide repeat protein n=1 Tax=Agarivorans sp. DSG3-1 TaxID=3342249 RepID=UPI00398E3E30
MNRLIIWCVACSILLVGTVFNATAETDLTSQQLKKWCAKPNQEQRCYLMHKQLADDGRAESAYWVGKVIARGVYQPADLEKAADYYKVASDSLHPSASRELGLLYYHGVYGEREFRKAQKMFEQAMQNGNSEGMWALARMYHYGRGVKQSYQKAFELFSLAAEQGSKPAANTLAYYYRVGLGTEVNPRLASYWQSKANAKGLVTWNRSIPDYR